MKIFISYHPNDKNFVAKLRRDFANAGIFTRVLNLYKALKNDIYFDLEEILPNIDYVIPVLSDTYVKDKWIQKELTAFLMREQKLDRNLIYPIIKEKCKLPVTLRNCQCFDTQKTGERKFTDIVNSFLAKRKAFVNMSFNNPELDLVYTGKIKPAFEAKGYEVIRADEKEDSEKVSPRILSEIKDSDIVFSDLTDARPNCYFETGYAQALSKKSILTIKKGDQIHFDLADNKFIVWNNPVDLKDRLNDRLEAIQKEFVEKANKALNRKPGKLIKSSDT